MSTWDAYRRNAGGWLRLAVGLSVLWVVLFIYLSLVVLQRLSHLHCCPIAEQIEEAAMYGHQVTHSGFSWPTMKAGVDRYIKRLNGIYERNLANSNVATITGRAKFVDKKVYQRLVCVRVCGESPKALYDTDVIESSHISSAHATRLLRWMER